MECLGEGRELGRWGGEGSFGVKCVKFIFLLWQLDFFVWVMVDQEMWGFKLSKVLVDKFEAGA